MASQRYAKTLELPDSEDRLLGRIYGNVGRNCHGSTGGADGKRKPSEELFNGGFGVRTLAKTEKMYRIVKSGNPSCWLGPVWGISNYMCYRGLKNYGYDKEAAELAEKTITLFGKDLEACGELHEYYDPDTGEGVNNPGFQCWNLLVNNMIAEEEGRKAIREF